MVKVTGTAPGTPEPERPKIVAALPEDHWKPDQHEVDAIREWGISGRN